MEDEEEVVDLWATDSKISLNTRKFKSYMNKSKVDVKAVVLPKGGISYNPSAKDHQSVIDKVVDEEKLEILETQRRLKHIKPHLFMEEEHKVDPMEIEDSDEDAIAYEIQNPPVDRLLKLTQTQKNRKVILSLNFNS